MRKNKTLMMLVVAKTSKENSRMQSAVKIFFLDEEESKVLFCKEKDEKNKAIRPKSEEIQKRVIDVVSKKEQCQKVLRLFIDDKITKDKIEEYIKSFRLNVIRRENFRQVIDKKDIKYEEMTLRGIRCDGQIIIRTKRFYVLPDVEKIEDKILENERKNGFNILSEIIEKAEKKSDI